MAWTPTGRAGKQPPLAVSDLRRCNHARLEAGQPVPEGSCAKQLWVRLQTYWSADLPCLSATAFVAPPAMIPPPLDPDRTVDVCVSADNNGTSSPYLGIVRPICGGASQDCGLIVP
jgi:hypothetical protein